MHVYGQIVIPAILGPTHREDHAENKHLLHRLRSVHINKEVKYDYNNAKAPNFYLPLYISAPWWIIGSLPFPTFWSWHTLEILKTQNHVVKTYGY